MFSAFATAANGTKGAIQAALIFWESGDHSPEDTRFRRLRAAPLHGDMAGSFRLRLGDYRVLFTLEENVMRIFGVRNLREAYR